MLTSDKGRAFIVEWEKPRLTVYRDGIGHLTVGIGHLVSPADGLQLGDRITPAQMNTFFEADLAEVDAALAAFDLEQCEYDALASFVFNIGAARFLDSTLCKFLRKGKKLQAADQLLRWNHANGRVVRGLTERREAERELFLSGVYDAAH